MGDILTQQQKQQQIQATALAQANPKLERLWKARQGLRLAQFELNGALLAADLAVKQEALKRASDEFITARAALVGTTPLVYKLDKELACLVEGYKGENIPPGLEQKYTGVDTFRIILDAKKELELFPALKENYNANNTNLDADLRFEKCLAAYEYKLWLYVMAKATNKDQDKTNAALQNITREIATSFNIAVPDPDSSLQSLTAECVNNYKNKYSLALFQRTAKLSYGPAACAQIEQQIAAKAKAVQAEAEAAEKRRLESQAAEQQRRQQQELQLQQQQQELQLRQQQQELELQQRQQELQLQQQQEQQRDELERNAVDVSAKIKSIVADYTQHVAKSFGSSILRSRYKSKREVQKIYLNSMDSINTPTEKLIVLLAVYMQLKSESKGFFGRVRKSHLEKIIEKEFPELKYCYEEKGRKFESSETQQRLKEFCFENKITKETVSSILQSQPDNNSKKSSPITSMLVKVQNIAPSENQRVVQPTSPPTGKPPKRTFK